MKPRKPTRYPTAVKTILQTTAERHGVTFDDIQGSRRAPHCVKARAEVAIQLRAMGWSFPRIAGYLGKNHASIMHLVRRYGPAPVAISDIPAIDESGIWAI